MPSVRAGLFTITIHDRSTHQVENACQVYCNNPAQYEVESDSTKYRLTDTAWDAQSRIMTGTIWRVRETELPARLRNASVHQLGIAQDEDLGEAASFAYSPSRHSALIEYSHNGPRHSVLRSVLYTLLQLDTAIAIDPVPTDDAIQRLQDAALVRRLVFTIADPDNAALLRSQGGSVESAIDAMNQVGGTTIRIEISMGHRRGGLSDTVRDTIRSLAHSHQSLSSLKAAIKNTPDSAPEILDFLGGRTVLELDIPTRNRALDHAQCRTKLQVSLRNHLNRRVP